MSMVNGRLDRRISVSNPCWGVRRFEVSVTLDPTSQLVVS